MKLPVEVQFNLQSDLNSSNYNITLPEEFLKGLHMRHVFKSDRPSHWSQSGGEELTILGRPYEKRYYDTVETYADGELVRWGGAPGSIGPQGYKHAAPIFKATVRFSLYGNDYSATGDITYIQIPGETNYKTERILGIDDLEVRAWAYWYTEDSNGYTEINTNLQGASYIIKVTGTISQIIDEVYHPTGVTNVTIYSEWIQSISLYQSGTFASLNSDLLFGAPTSPGREGVGIAIDEEEKYPPCKYPPCNQIVVKTNPNGIEYIEYKEYPVNASQTKFAIKTNQSTEPASYRISYYSTAFRNSPSVETECRQYLVGVDTYTWNGESYDVTINHSWETICLNAAGGDSCYTNGDVRLINPKTYKNLYEAPHGIRK